MEREREGGGGSIGREEDRGECEGEREGEGDV